LSVWGAETVPLAAALGRVLAADLAAEVDVPSFDRSNMDGYALRADDTYGASEESPRRLRLGDEEIPTGAVPRRVVEPGTASPIASGGMLPRGADAVLMVEHARVDGECLEVLHPVAPGANLSFAGTDVAKGELVLRRGTLLSARETGLLAGRRPPGFAVEVRSHNGVAAAVSQGRADWGVAIEPVARAYGLAFLPRVPSGMISPYPPAAGIVPPSRPSAGSGTKPRHDAGSPRSAS